MPASTQSQESTEALLFGLLKSRGIALRWSATSSPRQEVDAECNTLANDSAFMRELSSYLVDNPVIVQSLDTVLFQLAFSAGVDWQSASEVLRPAARRGWHLARWLPTFLLIDGPLGRLLREGKSPLARTLRIRHADLPLLASSRDAFNHNLFRLVRNGFAHWSFTWRDEAASTQIEIINNETGTRDASISLLEAEALHYLAASVMQSIGKHLLRRPIQYDG
jgi:hypothetical protein